MVVSCPALTPSVSVPCSKSVQNKVDSILVSASAGCGTEGGRRLCPPFSGGLPPLFWLGWTLGSAESPIPLGWDLPAGSCTG